MSSATMLGSDAHLPRQIRSPCSADRDCRLFHRHVETNIFFHGCSPFDAWARRPVVSPYFHPIGEQPLILRGDSLPRLPHVDGSSTGTRVPKSGRRLRLPRFGGASYAV